VTAALVVLVALLGLLIGSFLNVVIWRVPRGESVVSPGSACPACGHPVRARDNVPVLSWLLLRGRCRDCGAPISVRYTVVEVVTAALFGLVAAAVGWDWSLPLYLYLVGWAVALTAIDVELKRLPDALVLPAYPVVAALLAVATWAPPGTDDAGALVRAVIGGAALGAFYFLALVVYPRGMGFGDVKLAGVLGLVLAWHGWGSLLIGGFAAFLIAGLAILPGLLTRRLGRSSEIPFGPFMLAGAAVGVVVGEPLWSAYLGAFA
jgi:leader peptidase (prepilin peptidase)/N-methyltransferase